MEKELILFDIDGTLLEKNSKTDLPYLYALERQFGKKDLLEGIVTTARSDWKVYKEVLNKENIPYSKQLFENFLSIYEEELQKFQEKNIWKPNADVIDFLKKIPDNFSLALLTGNLEIAAKYKLSAIGVYSYFPVGGFGEDGESRNDIAEVALKKAKEFYKKDFSKIFVIGDTPLDIKCAQHISAISVSIATGTYGRDELLKFSPDICVKKFSELKIFLK